MADEGESPRAEHLMKLAEQADLRPRDATEVVRRARQAVAGSGKVAEWLRLSKAKTGRVSSRSKEIDV